MCSEISFLDPEEQISEVQLKHHIIHCFKLEYIPYVTPIQRWAQQSSLKEFEDLLCTQQSLAKYMTVSIKHEEGSALLATKKNYKEKQKNNSSMNRYATCWRESCLGQGYEALVHKFSRIALLYIGQSFIRLDLPNLASPIGEPN